MCVKFVYNPLSVHLKTGSMWCRPLSRAIIIIMKAQFKAIYGAHISWCKVIWSFSHNASQIWPRAPILSKGQKNFKVFMRIICFWNVFMLFYKWNYVIQNGDKVELTPGRSKWSVDTNELRGCLFCHHFPPYKAYDLSNPLLLIAQCLLQLACMVIELPHKVKMQYLHFRSHVEYFLLSWKNLEVISRRSILFHN